MLHNKVEEYKPFKKHIQEITIILQAPSVKKLKYAEKMLYQIDILDTTIVDLIFKKAYIANTLINPQDLLFTFYKIDFLLKHQNKKFKQF